jgi:hypothetical protein
MIRNLVTIDKQEYVELFECSKEHYYILDIYTGSSLVFVKDGDLLAAYKDNDGNCFQVEYSDGVFV